MRNSDTIEFYNVEADPRRNLVAVVKSSIVPPVESKINIRGKTYIVMQVTYAIDHADDATSCLMRANVDLRLA